jgi:hypothetical protein
MNVREIVTAHLKAGGFDGLTMDDCGCDIDDIMPCGACDMEECMPAKKVFCRDMPTPACGNCEGECDEEQMKTAYIFITAEQPANEEETHL